MTDLKLLCTDLDRTLLPNGEAVEEPRAREQLADYLRQHQVCLAFVTGRDKERVQRAINEYQLPPPDYVIADVGTTLYRCEHEWQPLADWHQHIGADWRYDNVEDIRAVLADVPGLRLQEESKQGRYKLSFYTPLDWNLAVWEASLQQRLATRQWRARLVYSVDEAAHCGLLDIVPASAGKLSAIHHLMKQLQLGNAQVLFAGDSGNDLDVLCSDLPAVLVANASDEVREQALQLASQAGTTAQLYLAQGTLGNGHYAAGILEGIAHFYGAGSTGP